MPTLTRTCKYCRRDIAVDEVAYQQNPYCAKCLPERLAIAAAEEPLIRWVRDGRYLRPVRLARGTPSPSA